jgi:lactoylglutathione lyase
MASSFTTASASAATGLNAFKPRILHTAYFVADIDRAKKFYCDVLGMKELQQFDLGEGVQEVILGFPDSKGAGVILMWNTRRTTPYQYGDSYSRFVMMVADLDAAMAHLIANGVKISKQLTDIGALRYCMIKDPDDYTIEVLQLKQSTV